MSWQTEKSTLGEGTYGIVRRALLTDSAGERTLCAQKQFRDEDGCDVGGLNQIVVRELHALTAVPPHPCLLRASVVVAHMKKVYTLTPLFATDLATLVRRHAHGGLPESVLRGVAAQLVSGLAHLHAHGFMHRDIKAENVLVTADGRCAVADLGMARYALTAPTDMAPTEDADTPPTEAAPMIVDTHISLTPNVCTLWTRAPEVCLLMTGGGGGSYTAAADVWSLGATLLMAAGGRYVLRSAQNGGVSDFLWNVWRLLGKPPAAEWPMMHTAATRGGNAFAALPPAAFPPYYGGGPPDEARWAAAEARLAAALERTDLSRPCLRFLLALLVQVPDARPTLAAAAAHEWLASVPTLSDAAAAVAALTAETAPPPPLPTALRAPQRLPPAAVVWTADMAPRLPTPAYTATGADVLPYMRSVLVAWLWEVATCRSAPLAFAVFCDAVQLLDAYLAARPDTTRASLQLVGITAMALATSVHEVCAMDAPSAAYMCDNAYTTAAVRAMQVQLFVTTHMFVPPPQCRVYTQLAAAAAVPAVRCAAAAVLCMDATLQWAACNARAVAAVAVTVAARLGAPLTPPPLDADAAACLDAFDAAMAAAGDGVRNSRSVWTTSGRQDLAATPAFAAAFPAAAALYGAPSKRGRARERE